MKHSNNWNNNRNEVATLALVGLVCEWLTVAAVWWFEVYTGAFLTHSSLYLTPSSCIYNKLAVFSEWEKNIYDVHTQNDPPSRTPNKTMQNGTAKCIYYVNGKKLSCFKRRCVFIYDFQYWHQNVMPLFSLSISVSEHKMTIFFFHTAA